MNSNWITAKIEEIAEVNPRLGKTDISDDLMVSFVPMPAVGAGDSSIDVTNLRPFGEVKKGFTKFQEGDVLFAKITPCMENGKMAVVPKVSNGYGFGSTEFHVLRPKEGIDARYLYYYVSSRQFRGAAERNMTGAVGQKRVPTKYLKEQEIPIAPLEQQERIVAEIEKQFSRLDGAVANLKRVKANLKRYKAAVLKAAVEGKLTEEWRKTHFRSGSEGVGVGLNGVGAGLKPAPTGSIETGAELLERILEERRANWQGRGKYKEPVAPDTSGLPELPEGWVWASIGILPVDVFDGPFGSNLKSRDYVSSGVRVIRLENIGSREFIDDKESFVTQEKYEQLKKHTVRHGDIIFSSFVADETRVVMLPTHIKKAINKADCFCVRVNTAAINNRYLETFLATRNAYSQLVREVHGATRPRINTKQLKDCLVPIAPVAEQAEIVSKMSEILSMVEVVEAEIETNQHRADRLRQSILKQAFSGQLVPQDPNDEPASVLLERIGANADGVGATRRVARKRSAEGGRGSAARRCDRPNP